MIKSQEKVVTLSIFCAILLCLSLPIYSIENKWSIPGSFPDTFPPGANDVVGLAMDGLGNAVAFWTVVTVRVPGVYAIRASRYSVVEEKWSQTKTFLAAAYDNEISIASDSAGNALLAWYSAYGGTKRVQATYYPITQNWDSWVPEILDVKEFTSTQTPIPPRIAMSNNGTAIITWSYELTGTWSTEATLYDNSTAWSQANLDANRKTNFPTDYGRSGLRVAMDSSGRAVFTLQDSNNYLYATRYDGTTSWALWNPATTNKAISSGVNATASPALAMNGPGSAVFSWTETNTIVGTLFDTTNWSAWSPNRKPISTALSGISDVAINDSNEIIFAWNSTDTNLLDVRVSRYDGTVDWASWTPPVPTVVSADQDEIKEVPPKQVVLDNNGNAVVIIYVTYQDADDKAQASIYDSTESVWKGPVGLSQPESGAVLAKPAPAIRVPNPNPEGITSMVVWSDADGTRFSQVTTKEAAEVSRVNPAFGFVNDSASDDIGNIHLSLVAPRSARRAKQPGTSAGVLLTHAPDDPVLTWARKEISSASHDVTQASVGASAYDNLVFGYIDASVGPGRAWASVGDSDQMGSPVQLSDAGHDAQDIQVKVSNTARNPNAKAVAVYVDDTVTLARKKELLGDIEVEIADVYRSNGVLYEGGIWVSLYDPDSATWTRTQLSTPTAANPRVAMSDIGEPYVVWQFKQGADFKIQAAYASYDDMTGTWSWQGVKDLSTTNAEKPRVATNSLGTTTVFAWRKYDGANWRIEATWWDGRDWSVWMPALTYLSPSGRDADDPTLDLDSAGNALVAWKISDGANDRIQSARLDTLTKTWGLPATTRSIPQYLSPSGVDASLPYAALGAQGYGLVTYNADNTSFNLYSPDTQTFGNATSTGFPLGTQQLLPFGSANYNGTEWTVINTLRSAVRANGDDEVYVLLASSRDGGPAVPTNVALYQETHRFPTQADLINVISWQAGDDTAVQYEIYADAARSQLIGRVPSILPLVFYHHCRRPGASETYYLFAVNAAGEYSNYVEISS